MDIRITDAAKELKLNPEHAKSVILEAKEEVVREGKFNYVTRKALDRVILRREKNPSFKNTLKELIEKSIPFAVGVEPVSLIKGAIPLGLNYKAYIYIEDKIKGYKNSNQRNKAGRKYAISERDLNEFEIDFFKDNQMMFNKVKHDKEGRIYELKETPFKTYYESKFARETKEGDKFYMPQSPNRNQEKSEKNKETI